MAPATLCGGSGGQLDASKGATFAATVTGVPAGKAVTFRFKYRDPAAKNKPNTNCLDTSRSEQGQSRCLRRVLELDEDRSIKLSR